MKVLLVSHQYPPAHSAGTEPDAAPAAPVVELLCDEGIDVSEHRPRRVRPEDLSRASRVISMGCDVSALAPADPTLVERWEEIPAPSADLEGARRAIGARVSGLLDEESAG